MDFNSNDFIKNNNPNIKVLSKFENNLHDILINVDTENQLFRDL